MRAIGSFEPRSTYGLLIIARLRFSTVSTCPGRLRVVGQIANFCSGEEHNVYATYARLIILVSVSK